MKRRRILLVLAVLVTAVLVVVLWPGEKEPEYQGKKLSEWLAEGDLKDSDEAVYAIRQIGTNGVPHLLRWLEQRRSPWPKRLLVLAKRLPSGSARDKAAGAALDLDVRLGALMASRAEYGFRILGSNAVSAVPRLTSLLQSPDKTLRIHAMVALAGIGAEGLTPLSAAAHDERYVARASAVYWLSQSQAYRRARDARALVPFLLTCLKDKDPGVVVSAARGMPAVEFARTVPALVSAAQDDNPDIRRMALWGLERFGEHASPEAIPALIKALQDTDPYVQEAGTNALEQVAPEKLEKFKGGR